MFKIKKGKKKIREGSGVKSKLKADPKPLRDIQTGASCRARTYDIRINSATLLPTELRRQIGAFCRT